MNDYYVKNVAEIDQFKLIVMAVIYIKYEQKRRKQTEIYNNKMKKKCNELCLRTSESIF